MTRHYALLPSIAVLALCSLMLPHPSRADDSPIDPALAESYFAEAQALCEADGGELWGLSLCVPMAFIEPGSRTVVTNQPDEIGALESVGGVWVGKWPEDIGVANSTAEWNGKKWTTLLWPLPEDRFMRARLLMHESYHYIQADLGFPMIAPPNVHLDRRDGRYWIQLEWRALLKALQASGEERYAAIRDALAFRAQRRAIFPGAASEESRMEMNEGLAEYTGQKLSGASLPALVIYLTIDLQRMSGLPTLVSSFAYWSGPAYGLLLDQTGTDWKTNLSADSDFGDLLKSAYAIEMPDSPAAFTESRSEVYDGAALLASETAREEKKNRELAGYRQRFVDGPVLILPLVQISIQYDPNGLVPLDDLGTVYPTIFIADLWGRITVSNGALLSSDWRSLRVAAPANPDARPLQESGWSLELNDGWTLSPGPREGDFTLKKQ